MDEDFRALSRLEKPTAVLSSCKDTERVQIKLSENFRAVFYAPFYATLALGFFAREGVDVRLIDSSAPGSATTGLVDGSIDVTWGGPMRVMKSRNEPNAPDLVCFCEVVRRDPFYLVGRRDRGTFALEELATLKLASVSEVPTPWLCLQHDLREIGIDPARVHRIADRSMPENLGALERGEIDVAQMFEPFATQAVRRGLKILHAASARGDTSYTTFLATRASATKNRAAFAAMTSAVGHMQTWLVQHTMQELAATVAPYFGHVPHGDLVDAFARYKAAHLWADSTPVSRAGFDRLAQSLHSGGFIASVPAYADCVVG